MVVTIPRARGQDDLHGAKLSPFLRLYISTQAPSALARELPSASGTGPAGEYLSVALRYEHL